MIIFVNKWSKDEKNSWSGTPEGIRGALMEVCGNDMIISSNVPNTKIIRIRNKIWRIVTKSISLNGCELYETKSSDKLVNKRISAYKTEPVLMFFEYNTDKIKDTYIYIDCSVDYVYRCIKERKSYTKYLPLFKKSRFSLLEKRKERSNKFNKQCKGIFTMSRWLADDLINNSGVDSKKVHSVGGGCNIPLELIDDTKKQGNKILFVGKDFERKGGKIVLEAFKHLKNMNNNNYQLYIAGPEQWPLEEIPRDVHFVGRKSMEELSEYYNMCDIFVMPSYFEAYGIVFAEALIYGLPCIARKAFAMKEFIQDGKNGILIHDDDTEKLAQKMYELLNNNSIKKYVIDNRQNYINQYSWTSVAKRIVDVIKSDGYN